MRGSLFWDVARHPPRGAGRPARGGPHRSTRRHRHRLVGGRLRPARPRRRAARQPLSPPRRRAPTACPSRCCETVGAAELYAVTGLQQLPFNTVFQLVAAQGTAALESAETLLLLPDLLAYWLTGEVGAERTNASTTGLYDVRSREWALDLAKRLGLPWSILPPLRDPGSVDRPAAARGRRSTSARPASRSSPSAPTTPPPPSSACRRARTTLRLHLLGHLVAGRARARRAGAHRGGPRGQLHQRGRRRRHHPLPQERDGPVGALASRCAPGSDRRLRTRRCRPCWPGGRGAPPLRTVIDIDDPRLLRRRGDMPARILALAEEARRADPAHAGRDHPHASSTASRSPTAATSRSPAELAGRDGRRRAHRRRRLAERAALPADRRRPRRPGARRPGRGRRARQRAGAGARPRAPTCPTWPRCARWSRRTHDVRRFEPRPGLPRAGWDAAASRLG